MHTRHRRRAWPWLLIGFLVGPAAVWLLAQATMIHTSGTLPANCTVGGVYLKTGASAGFYICLATDTWTGPLGAGAGSGDVVGPASATDEALARFDTTTGKLLQDGAVTLSDTGAFTLPDGVRQTFNPDATVAGLNVGSQAGDPSTPTNGDLWYDSTANELTGRINGANVALGSGGAAGTGSFGITIDGGGSVITTGVKGFIEVPFSGTITQATLLSTDASATAGSIVLDVWCDTYANYAPTDADSITASAPPTLSAANKSQDATLTGWTTAVTAGAVCGFTVDSATTVTRVTLILTVDKS